MPENDEDYIFLNSCGLWVWVVKYFNTRQLDQNFSIEQAVTKAKSLALIATPMNTNESSYNQIFVHGTIAGTAATICCFDETNRYRNWVNTTLELYLNAIEPRLDVYSQKLSVPWHPKIFVAHALGFRIRNGHASLADYFNLYRLAIHPLESISLVAFDEIASAWEYNQRFVWCGFNLGLRLSKLPRPYLHGELEDKRREEALFETCQEYKSDENFPNWVEPIPFWVKDPTKYNQKNVGLKDGWQLSSEIFASSYAAEILNKVPVAGIMKSAAKDQYLDDMEKFF